MDTKHITAVVTVARCGTFTYAAKELHLSQSALSRQIIALERELGVALFVRGGRSVKLTQQGRAFLRNAGAVLEAVAAAEVAARRTL